MPATDCTPLRLRTEMARSPACVGKRRAVGRGPQPAAVPERRVKPLSTFVLQNAAIADSAALQLPTRAICGCTIQQTVTRHLCDQHVCDAVSSRSEVALPPPSLDGVLWRSQLSQPQIQHIAVDVSHSAPPFCRLAACSLPIAWAAQTPTGRMTGRDRWKGEARESGTFCALDLGGRCTLNKATARMAGRATPKIRVKPPVGLIRLLHIGENEAALVGHELRGQEEVENLLQHDRPQAVALIAHHAILEYPSVSVPHSAAEAYDGVGLVAQVE
eukprot:5761544-Prymnesium_polylepis.1